jgi:renalase
MTFTSVAIIGAGLAGLACADSLGPGGSRVRLFDKGRAPGGRLATRRVELPDGRTVRFDHGAQFVTARDPTFAERIAEFERLNVVAPFPWPIFRQSTTGADTNSDDGRFVGAEGMSCIPKAMARAHDVVCNRQVSSISRGAEIWRVNFTDGPSEGGFDAVVVAVPAEQVSDLIVDVAPVFAAEAMAARTAPCWAGLFVFEGGGEPAFGAIRIDDGGPLAWLARAGDGEGWVAHATPAWSRLHLEHSAEAVALGLEAAVRRLLPDVGATVFLQAHRWRFAQVEVPAKTAFAWDQGLRLGLCGDWRLGPRAELAWLSGDRLGRAMSAARAPA